MDYTLQLLCASDEVRRRRRERWGIGAERLFHNLVGTPGGGRGRCSSVPDSLIGGQGEGKVPPYTRGSVSLSHGGQGESRVPPVTRARVSPSLYS